MEQALPEKVLPALLTSRKGIDMDNRYKVVKSPILIPKGDFCWNMDNHAICEYFEASGGNPRCDIRMGFLEYADDGGVLKPKKCKLLKYN